MKTENDNLPMDALMLCLMLPLPVPFAGRLLAEGGGAVSIEILNAIQFASEYSPKKRSSMRSRNTHLVSAMDLCGTWVTQAKLKKNRYFPCQTPSPYCALSCSPSSDRKRCYWWDSYVQKTLSFQEFQCTSVTRSYAQ